MISVLMLTHNRENMVGRAIESILNQTYKDFELVIVDDGSTDNSGKIADEYAKNDNRIRVIHQIPNIGMSRARNKAIDAAKGDYLTFIDDDDWAELDYLEFLLNLITENDADISICGADNRNFDEKRVMTAEQALIELMWRKKYNPAFASKMFRKKLWNGIRCPEDTSPDDAWVTYKLIGRAKRVAYHGLPKYTFYKHESNDSAWTLDNSLINSKILDTHLKGYRSRTEWLSERFPNSAAAFRYFEWSFMISMVEKIHRFELKDCEKHLLHMTEELSKHRRDFLNCPEIQDFEREWLDKYITV